MPNLDNSALFDAYQREILAESTRARIGNSDLSRTAHKIAQVLTKFNIPHSIVGGFAVQHHGYPRFTEDVDVVVPNVEEARDKLSMNGFKEVQGTSMIITDRSNAVRVDLLPGGRSLSPKAQVMLPNPLTPQNTPSYVDLSALISLKLDTYRHNPKRIQDLADAGKLIENNNLPIDYPVDNHVKKEYEDLWRQVNS